MEMQSTSLYPLVATPGLIASTPKDAVLRDGGATLYRFRGSRSVKAAPVLLVPSMINRWYVLDLRSKASVAEALAGAGLDVFLLDWGVPRPEDRDFSWADAVARLERMVKRVLRETKASQLTLLGYCMGATLASVHASLHPQHYAGFVNLLGPVDFVYAGLLGRLTDEHWFDAGLVADAGNVTAEQMQAGFTLLRPTAQIAKWVNFVDKLFDPAFRESFEALETWASDNIPFPAEAYRTYMTDLYQKNLLVQGKHYVAGRRVDLSSITCPVLTVTAERDAICPPKAALALNESVGSKAKASVVSVPGGHVGAVVGSKAADKLYPQLIAFMKERTWS